MGSLLGDFRYAFRSLVRQPTFAAMAILTLVLGIGTNTAIFSVIKAVLLNKLPYEDPSRLVVLWEQNPDGNTDLVAPLTYLDWKEQAKSIQSMTAFRQLRYAFAGDGQPLNVPSVRATAEPVLDAPRQRDGGPDVSSRRRHPGPRPGRGPEPRILGAPFRRRAGRDRADDSAGRPAVHDCRRHAGGIRFPAERQRRCLDPAQLRPQRRARTIAQGQVAQRHRSPRRRRNTGPGAAGDEPGREPAGLDFPRQQHRVGRSPRGGAGTTGDDGPARAAADIGSRRIPVADRLRQRRQPDAGAALEPARRAGRACRARRRTRAARASGPGGKRPAVSGRRRAGPVRGVGRRPVRARAACRQPAANAGRAAWTAACCSSRCWHRPSCRWCSASCRRCRRRGRAFATPSTRFPARPAEPARGSWACSWSSRWRSP